MCPPHVSSILKKSVQKLLDRNVNVLKSCLQNISTKFLLVEAVAAIDICNKAVLLPRSLTVQAWLVLSLRLCFSRP
jgi:hypothetical protein